MKSGNPGGGQEALTAAPSHAADRERALIERCRSGDEQAFQELIECYAPMVYTLIHRVLREPSRVEELAQQVFLRVHQGMPYFRGEARLSTWICRIVATACVQAGDRGASIPVPGDRLGEAIARLPPNYRLLIAAHGLEGVHYEDLAEALQLPPGSVGTHLHRAKRQLRRILGNGAVDVPSTRR
jgi:RNA polymerase sigma-70 factor (ECF subfamily)